MTSPQYSVRTFFGFSFDVVKYEKEVAPEGKFFEVSKDRAGEYQLWIKRYRIYISNEKIVKTKEVKNGVNTSSGG